MERKLFGFIVFFCVVTTSVSAHSISMRHDKPDTDYIVNERDFPALITLFHNPIDCMGTLIDERYVLTVAHCAQDLKHKNKKNKKFLLIRGVKHFIDKVILHPRWEESESDRVGDKNDIALIRLQEPVMGISPLPIYAGKVRVGDFLTIVGRGSHSNGLKGERDAPVDGQLRRATNVVSKVKKQYIEVVFDSPQSQGATSLEGVGIAGDSGCPVFMNVNGVDYIVGLNSWGSGGEDEDVGKYGERDYQTKVSKYIRWIRSEIN